MRNKDYLLMGEAWLEPSKKVDVNNFIIACLFQFMLFRRSCISVLAYAAYYQVNVFCRNLVGRY